MGYGRAIFSLLAINLILYFSTASFAENENIEKVVINSEKIISDCSKRGLDNKILFVGSKYCGYCVRAKPIVEKIIKQYNLEKYYNEYDLTDKEKLSELNKFKITVPYYPTLIVNCAPFLGAKSESDYNKILGGFNKK